MPRALIECVVVLYRQSPAESKALTSLLEICAADAELAGLLELLVQDNSPSPQEFVSAGDRKPFAEYYHAPDNPGLADAYNRALQSARDRGIPWLLLLDQDTRLTPEFMEHLRVALQQAGASEYCAFVPQLLQGSRVLSPQVVGRVLHKRIPLGFSGPAKQQILAFNSAACLSVKDLVAIGGFPKQFWLDYLDHMVFYRLQQAGGRIFVLNARLDHSISIAHIEADVSIERFSNILRAEWLFVRETGWGGGPPVHRARLLMRALSHSLKLRNKQYALYTLRAAFS